MVCPLKGGLNSKWAIRSRLMRKLRRRGSFEIFELGQEEGSMKCGTHAGITRRWLGEQSMSMRVGEGVSCKIHTSMGHWVFVHSVVVSVIESFSVEKLDGSNV